MKKPIRVAIIGTGRISDLHAIEYLQNPDARITVVCDKNTELAAARVKQWGCQADVEGDFDKVLDRDDVDMVEILLPHHLHLNTALKAIEARKIVSLQKPMTMNLHEANRLVAAVENSSKPFKIFENFIFYPPVIKAKELIESGSIGTPLSIRVKSNPGKSKTAWEVPKETEIWRQDKTLAGGGPLVFDDGHHKFSLIWYFMGMPEEMHAFIHMTERPGNGLFDAPSIISFRFPENRIGNFEIVYSPELEITGNYYPQDDRVEITGTHGIIWINCGHGKIRDVPPLVLYQGDEIIEFRDINDGWEQSFILSTRHFLKTLSEGGDPMLTVHQGRSILSLALAAEESAKKGRPILLSEFE